MPKVSICLPTYEQPDKLKALIDSICQQDFKDYEIVVSDDSVSNKVEKIIHNYVLPQLGPGSVKYFRNEVALGSPENWNNAVCKASGDYIKIIHHDDCLARTDAISQYVSVLEQNPESSFAFCISLHCNEEGVALSSNVPSTAQLKLLPEKPEILFAGNFIGAPSAIMFRHDRFIEFDKRMKWLVDIDFYIQMIKAYGAPVFIPEGLVNITVGSKDQITHQCHYNKEVDLREHVLLFEKMLASSASVDVCEEKWLKLFERYWVRDLDEVLGVCDVKQGARDYLTELMKRNRYRFFIRLPFYLYHHCKRNYA